jgi:hypothetical protein
MHPANAHCILSRFPILCSAQCGTALHCNGFMVTRMKDVHVPIATFETHWPPSWLAEKQDSQGWRRRRQAAAGESRCSTARYHLYVSCMHLARSSAAGKTSSWRAPCGHAACIQAWQAPRCRPAATDAGTASMMATHLLRFMAICTIAPFMRRQANVPILAQSGTAVMLRSLTHYSTAAATPPLAQWSGLCCCLCSGTPLGRKGTGR